MPPVGLAATRVDLSIVAEFVPREARVLDVGCDDGTLLELLRREKGVDGRGVEISQAGVNLCVARGLSVVQGDADTDLAAYPDKAFDVAILSRTLQATYEPRVVLDQLLRIGRRAIVSFPNFGHWRIRWQVAALGRMPATDELPHAWWETPNIHLCTVSDFLALSDALGARIEAAVGLYGTEQRIGRKAPWWVWNAFAEEAVFVLSRP